MYCSYTYNVGGVSCFTQVQKQLFYPLFNYWGNDNEDSMNASLTAGSTEVDFSSSKCACGSNMTKKEAKDCGTFSIPGIVQTVYVLAFIVLWWCVCVCVCGIDLFFLLPSWIWFPGKGGNDKAESFAFDALKHLVNDTATNTSNGDTYVMDKSFNAMKLNAYAALDSSKFSVAQMNGTLSKLCEGCTMLSILAVGDDKTLNKFQYQLEKGSCQAAASIFDTLAAAPPVALTERYFECTLTPFRSIFEAIGLSIGNTEVIVGIFFFFVMFAVSGYLRTSLDFNDGLFRDLDEDHEEEDAAVKVALYKVRDVLILVYCVTVFH